MVKVLTSEEILFTLQTIIAQVFKNLALPLAITKNHLDLDKSVLLKLKVSNSLHEALDNICDQLKQLENIVKLGCPSCNYKLPTKILTKLSIAECVKDITKHLPPSANNINFVIRDDFQFLGNLNFLKLIVVDLLITLTALAKNHPNDGIFLKTNQYKSTNYLILELNYPKRILDQYQYDKQIFNEIRGYKPLMQLLKADIAYSFKNPNMGIVLQFPNLDNQPF